MKNDIINISKKLNIPLIGFTDLNMDESLIEKYNEQISNNYRCSFDVGSINDKMLLSDKYRSFKSAIVIGVPYLKNNSKEIHFSSFTSGKDYHIVLNDKLGVIEKYLNDKGYKGKIFVDNNSLDERFLAYKSGLGFYGKNGLLINEKYGSFFFIGVLLTDALFDYDKAKKMKCFGCNLCKEMCPTHAINDSNILNQNACLSYITQKKNITNEEESLINSCVYGCDICQNICPYNKNIKENNELIDYIEFLNMTDEEFKKKYFNKSFYWRGCNVIKRNINCYLKNKSKFENKIE